MSQVQVQTGFVFPSAGVRVLIPLVVSAFMEEASGVSMNELSDYNIGVSVGSVPASAFSYGSPEDPTKPDFSAREVLYSTFATAHLMFARDAKTVATNNIWRDALSLLKDWQTNPVVKYIVDRFDSRKPSVESSRYDPKLLEEPLKKRLGDRKVSDAQKTFFIIAHGVKRGTPHYFAYIDPEKFPRPENLSLHIDNIPLHSDLHLVEAIMSATAIPGFIGYRRVDSLGEHFMDAGSFSAPSFAAIMGDMHDMTVARVKAEHAKKLSARTAWQKAVNILQPEEQAPQVVSRLVYFGIGNEKGLEVDTSNTRGVVMNALDIVRSASEHVMGFSFSQIIKRYNQCSVKHTGRPALQILDCSIVPNSPEEAAMMPSTDIKDGKIENLLRLMAFGRKIALEHREALCDEIILRMKTLHQRGLKTAEEVEDVTKRVSVYKDLGEATALCDKIVFGQGHVEKILEAQGILTPKPVANDGKQVPPSQNGGWGIAGGVRKVAASLSIVS